MDAIVRAIVKAKGNPSGIAETAKAITDKNISVPDTPFVNKIKAIIMAIIITSKLICFENLFILIVSGDASSLDLDTLSAIFPISVLRAIPTTTPLALPVVTVEPAKTMFF